MSEMIASYINGFSTAYFIRQSAVIVLMFMIGCLILLGINKGRLSLYEMLLCFPVGISAYSLSVFVLLVLGIPFNRISIGCMLLAIVIVSLTGIRKYTVNALNERGYYGICLITLLFIAAVSVSGLLPVSVSNDSMYYYSMYPHAIAHFGALRMQFNVFLTDVGQTSAILNTLPFVFGYNEGFGVQWFLNINTLLIVVYGLYDASSTVMKRKESCIVTTLMTGILLVSMPYLIMSKWVMSNGYFMCFVFICTYTAWKYGRSAAGGKDGIYGNKAVLAVLFPMMALLRMEGCIIALVLVLCLATLKGYTGRELFMIFLLPVLTVSVLYDVRIFVIMSIDAPYTFLTRTKAFIQIVAIVTVSGYVLFLRENVINRYLFILIPAGLIFVNGVLFLMNGTLYLENMKTFAANVSNQSGWGLFPMLVIGIYVMCLIAGNGKDDKELKENEPSSVFCDEDKHLAAGTAFWDLSFVSYILTALAVSFAREDALVENVADSGNRVMLQVTLIAFFAVAQHLIALIGENTKTDDKSRS